MGKDKILHALVCFVATIASFAYMHLINAFWPSFSASWLLPMGLGFGKEYGDSNAKGNKWDWWDILADVVGTAIGMAAIFVWHLIKER